MEESGGYLILCVEDDASGALILRRRLEAAGYRVETAPSGAAALQAAAERRPDLVLLDLKLPDMSGYSVCEALRKIFHPWRVPVLMLTGLDRSHDKLRGFGCGADAYLTKPYRPEELLGAVRHLLGEDDWAEEGWST